MVGGSLRVVEGETARVAGVSLHVVDGSVWVM